MPALERDMGLRTTSLKSLLVNRKKHVLGSFLMAILLYKCSQMVTDRVHVYVEHHHDMVRNLHNVYEWPSRKTTTCGGNFTGYAHKLFRMKSAIYLPETDSFQLRCENGTLPPDYTFIDNDYGLGKYITRIGQVTDPPPDKMAEQNGVTVIVDRCNAHNYYHAMQEWYNLYVTSKLFNYNFRDMKLFIIDRTPTIHIDIHWNLLFPNNIRAREIEEPIKFEDVLFNHAGPGNPWEYTEYAKSPPYIQEFPQAFLSSLNLTSNKVLNCRNLTITIGIRRDYFMNPPSKVLRNTQRKYKNEEEIMGYLRQTFSEHNIRTLVAEDMTVMQQLKLATETDILVGMHGCIFTNTLFMPKHGAIFEMYPKYWEIKPFFSDIARWRGILYDNWRNEDTENEFSDYRTYVPPAVVVTNINHMITRMGCL